MLNSFNKYEKNQLYPILIYWGFFKTVLELPKLSNLSYSFRLNKKEYVFILTFLSFFLKCFFLDQKMNFKIHYSNLILKIDVKRKDQNFLFFLYFLRLVSFFNIYDIKINKNILSVGKKESGFILISTTKFFFFISEIFNYVNFYNWYQLFFNQIYVLFQHIFYSTKGFSLNFFILAKFSLKAEYNLYFKKILQFYTIV